MKQRGNDDPTAPAPRQLCVHNEATKPTISVAEWVQLGDEEGVEDGAGKTFGDVISELGALSKGAAYEGWGDEPRGPSIVDVHLGLPRHYLRSHPHHFSAMQTISGTTGV